MHTSFILRSQLCVSSHLCLLNIIQSLHIQLINLFIYYFFNKCAYNFYSCKTNDHIVCYHHLLARNTMTIEIISRQFSCVNKPLIFQIISLVLKGLSISFLFYILHPFQLETKQQIDIKCILQTLESNYWNAFLSMLLIFMSLDDNLVFLKLVFKVHVLEALRCYLKYVLRYVPHIYLLFIDDLAQYIVTLGFRSNLKCGIWIDFWNLVLRLKLDVHVIWNKKHDYVGHYKFDLRCANKRW